MSRLSEAARRYAHWIEYADTARDELVAKNREAETARRELDRAEKECEAARLEVVAAVRGDQ